MMFSGLFNKEKPRVYLGSIVVAPRSEVKRIDEWGLFYRVPLDDGIRDKLIESFSLPEIPPEHELISSDLAMDLVVINIQGGELNALNFGIAAFPIWWRPKLEIRSRLYNIKTGKTQSSIVVKEKMPWKQYLTNALTVNGILFRYKPLFDVSDMEILLYKGCLKVIDKFRRSL